MQANRELPVCRSTRLAHAALAAALMLLPAALTAKAQRPQPDTASIKTFYLTNVTQQNDANEILVALRNMLNPETTRLYLVASQDAIVLKGSPDDLTMAQKLIGELDRPHKLYRLSYTVTTLDGSKPLDTAHYSMIVASGQRTSMKQGRKVPILTGSNNTDSSTPQTQYQYIDIGMSFNATAIESSNGIWLRTKVEQSSLSDEKSATGADPIVHQTVVESTSAIPTGKTVVLDSLDMPGTTHRMRIEVAAEPIP